MTKWIISFIIMGFICALVLDFLVVLAVTLLAYLIGFSDQRVMGLINVASFPIGFLVSYCLWPPPRRSPASPIGTEIETPLVTRPRMKRRWMILAGGVAAVCTVWMFFVPPKGKTEWRIVAPSDNSFTILMPGVPQETSTLGTSLAYGTVKTTFLMYEKEQWGYSVSWVDYPKGSQKQLDTEMALNQGRDGAVEGVQGKLLGEEHVNIEGHPGRKLRIQPATPQATLLVNMVVVGDRVYQITLVCPKQYSFSPKVSTFLDSFRLTKIESPQQAVKTR